jgi:hypothetical protein
MSKRWKDPSTGEQVKIMRKAKIVLATIQKPIMPHTE